MKSNYDYIKEFIIKHNYKNKVKVQCFGNVGIDSIKTVIFDKTDIPSERKIDIEDIKYDIESLLPEDVFYRWLEYVENKNNSYVSYIYWMTKMDNKYEPMGLDKSESEKLRKLIYNKIDELRNIKWF